MDSQFNQQIEDPYLRFIRQDSSQNVSDIFKVSPYHDVLHGDDQSQHILVADEQKKMKEKKSRQNSRAKSPHQKKMFYRDRMASLLNEEASNQVEYNYGDYNPKGRGQIPISRQEQLRRNRQSAKVSRQRRKQYVETLQQKNLQNQKLIDQLKRRLREAELERDRLKEENSSFMKSFFATRNECFENLNNTLNIKGKKCDESISEALKVMKAKYGAAGSQRVATTDYYMKQIIELLLGDIHKYLMECVLQDSGLFGLGQWSRLDDQIINILGVRKEIRINLNKSYHKQMERQFDSFKQVTHRFYEAYRVVQHQAKVIQRIFDKLILQFSNESIAQLLLWIEQNKFMKDLKKLRSQWAKSIDQPIEIGDKIRKMSKNQ